MDCGINGLKHSKVYRWPKGHVRFAAATVGNLLEFLRQFPSEMPVLTSWEGTVHSLAHPAITEFEGSFALEFDVEQDVTEENPPTEGEGVQE